MVRWAALAGVVLLAAAIGYFLGLTLPAAAIDRAFDDYCVLQTARGMSWLAPRVKPAAITLVAVDPATSELLNKPRMLWPAEFGEVIQGAASGGATAIALDEPFESPVTRWDEAADPLFFQAYTQVARPQLHVYLAYNRAQRPQPSQDSLPVYAQAASDGNLVSTRLTPDADGLVRELSSTGTASLVPPLAFSLANSPVLRDAVRIRYYGLPRQAFPSVSMADVLGAARANDRGRLNSWFSGRIVLIGGSESNNGTPVGLMSNVEIQAHTISTIQQHDSPQAASAALQWMLVAGAGLLGAAAVYFLRWYFSGPVVVFLGALVLAAVLAANARGVILHATGAELAIVFAALGAAAVISTAPQHRDILLRNAFAARVSPAVLGVVLDGETLPAEAERRDVTVMLCNVRGFAVQVPSADPPELLRAVNEYVDQMGECILRHGGFVQQLMGDRILAVFGAPARLPNHSHRAVVCAMEMLTRMDLLNERRSISQKDPWTASIGIHSGSAVLGFVEERRERLDYTIHGEVVKLATRLEALNKKFTTQILLSANTRDQMGVDIVTVWKGTLVRDDGTECSFYTV